MSDWYKHIEDICLETTVARENIDKVINSVIMRRPNIFYRSDKRQKFSLRKIRKNIEILLQEPVKN